MTDAPDTCGQCGRSLALVAADDVETFDESTGFGLENAIRRRFCSRRCHALYRDVDPVIDRTQQATLAAFDGTACDAAAWIAYSVDY